MEIPYFGRKFAVLRNALGLAAAPGLAVITEVVPG